jgi:formate-dependent nitrite reductase membrane component NrfD
LEGGNKVDLGHIGGCIIKLNYRQKTWLYAISFFFFGISSILALIIQVEKLSNEINFLFGLIIMVLFSTSIIGLLMLTFMKKGDDAKNAVARY